MTAQLMTSSGAASSEAASVVPCRRLEAMAGAAVHTGEIVAIQRLWPGRPSKTMSYSSMLSVGYADAASPSHYLVL